MVRPGTPRARGTRRARRRRSCPRIGSTQRVDPAPGRDVRPGDGRALLALDVDLHDHTAAPRSRPRRESGSSAPRPSRRRPCASRTRRTEARPHDASIMWSSTTSASDAEPPSTSSRERSTVASPSGSAHAGRGRITASDLDPKKCRAGPAAVADGSGETAGRGHRAPRDVSVSPWRHGASRAWYAGRGAPSPGG